MNPVMLVTGGSRGIGAAIARLAAQRCFDVAIAYRADERAASSVIDDVKRAGVRGLAVKADVADEREIVRLFRAVDQFGALGALVNNAGISGGFARVADLDTSVLASVLNLNVFGAILCAREAIRRMSTQWGGTGGSIVNITSLAAKIGGGNEWVHYAASKGAMETFTVGLGRELGAENVRVNAVSPGIVDTEMHAAAGDPHRIRRKSPEIPLGRAATANEIAEAVLWLVSPAASYVTGAILEVGGGR